MSDRMSDRMSDEFPLQALLRTRRATRDEAARKFTSATAALRTAVTELSDREQRHAALAEAIRAARAVDLGTALGELRRSDEYVHALQIEIADIRRAIEQQESLVSEHRCSVDEAKLTLDRAEIELEAVAVRKREWETARRRAARNRAEAELDELALRRWREAAEDDM